MKFIKEIILEYLKEEKLNESGFPRVIQMMSGLVDNVYTIGIVSAQDPGRDENFMKIKDVEEKRRLNKVRHNELKEKLRKMNLGFIEPDYGMYDGKEKSLIVPNITKKVLIGLSEFYKQESCIFGTKNVNEIGALFRWELIEEGIVLSEKIVYSIKADSTIQNANNYYTKVKGRKFVIPFFDDWIKSKDDIRQKHLSPDPDAYKKPLDMWRKK